MIDYRSAMLQLHRLARCLRRQTALTYAVEAVQRYAAGHHDRFRKAPYLAGRCNVCGRDTLFFCDDQRLYRESLNCAECGTTSRYRSIGRGVLRAMRELAGVDACSVAELATTDSSARLRVYDTQVPFSLATVGYPIPELLGRCHWMEVHCSLYKPGRPPGEELGPGITNQNLEKLTFPDGFFDLVITSDVMEHVRLDDRAHQEIARVLRPGGVYVFTVPHFRDRETLVRVRPADPDDPSADVYLTEPEYHGDGNSPDGRALSYRSYGTDLDEYLTSLGLPVQYTMEDYSAVGIMNTELFYCRKATCARL
jgi:SAM-dependent methyltransferase